MKKPKLLVVLAVTVMALYSTGTLVSQTPNPAPAFKSVEYLLLGDATRGSGEPMIAVDPTNPKNIIVTGMGTLGELPPPPPGGMPGTQSIPRSTIPWLAVTHDGGTTWKVGELPILLNSTFTRCPDPIADVTKQGVFLAGCEPRETTGEQYGTSALVASDDKGITWGPRVDIISSFGAARFAPGLKPRFQGASPWDRPFTFIDDSTGAIYGVAQGGSTDIDTEPGKYRNQSYITASTDGALGCSRDPSREREAAWVLSSNATCRIPRWLLMGLALQQGFSTSVFTLASDLFPAKALGSVIGIGGAISGLGSILAEEYTGRVLQAHPGNFLPMFVAAGTVYLVCLLVIHMLAPKLDPMDLR